MRRFLSISTLVLAAIAADATVVGGIRIPQQRDDLELLGAGLLRKGLFFKVYTGALYVTDTGSGGLELAETPKRLDVYYYHKTPKKYMIRAADKALRKNLGDEEYVRLRPAIQLLHDTYIDGQKGAVASIIHRPGEGLTYMFNDRKLLTIPDDRFANAYFTIWLGDRPSSRTMKKALLGEHYERNLDG
jgi:hypothetical protein